MEKVKIWDKGYKKSMLRAFAGRELKNPYFNGSINLGILTL